MPEIEVRFSDRGTSLLEVVARAWGMCPDADLEEVASKLLEQGLDARAGLVPGAKVLKLVRNAK